MPLDYSGQNLRGRSFRGKNLEGANFSGAHIRSVDFTGANLTRANFSHVEAGLQKRWALFLVLVSWLIMALSGLLSAFTGVLVTVLVFSEKGYDQIAFQIAGWTIIVIFVIFFFVTIRQGIQRGLEGFAFAGAVAFVVGGVGSIIVTVVADVTIAGVAGFYVAFTGSIAFAFAGAVAVAGAGAVAGAVAVAGAGAGAGAVTVGLAVTGVGAFTFVEVVAKTGAGAGAVTVAIAIAVAVAVAVALVLLTIYISWRALKGDPEHSLIRDIVIVFAAFKGTSFRNADLTDANFTEATLKNTDFINANLTRTCFHKTKKLDLIRPGLTYLKNIQLRQLLVTGFGQNKNFDRQNLRGVNFQEAELSSASFIDTDLSQANLHSANLFEAKLVRTNLDLANLSNTHLTGAYIEDWGITRKTRLASVECKYVYLKLPIEGERDPNRMPPSEQGDFGENDFNIFITSVLDTLDLYHKQDINAHIAITVLKGLTTDYPVQFELVGLEKRGNNQFLIRLKVFGQASHFQLQREYYARYEQTLPLYDPKKLMPDTEAIVEEIIKTVQQNPGTRIENLHNQGIVITGGSVSMTSEHNRTINTGGGNYNEQIQGNYIQGNYYTSAEKQSLADAAIEIQQLLHQLSLTNTTTNEAVTEAIYQEIKQNPTLKARLKSALKAGGLEAVKAIFNHPLFSIPAETIKGWLEAE